MPVNSRSPETLSSFGTLVRLPDTHDPEHSRSELKPLKMKSKAEKCKRSHSVSDGDDVGEENGVLFWVNKSGFPIDDNTWQRMWDHVAKIHPGGTKMAQTVRRSHELLPVSSIRSH